MNTGELYGQNT